MKEMQMRMKIREVKIEPSELMEFFGNLKRGDGIERRENLEILNIDSISDGSTNKFWFFC